MTLANSKGSIFYGMHFYPGVAEYKELGIRVFVNEDTIRRMGPTMAGRPVYVFHKDEVPTDMAKLRAEADGWAIESFFNEADGKHWVKFIVCSEKGERAIKNGYGLSNAYTPDLGGPGGEHNGVAFNKEVKGGEYDHLAIVPDPRYEQSVIMTPEQFKEYNESKRIELTRLANSKEGDEVKIQFFRKQKVEKIENSADLESMSVLLPKSGREMTISQLVNAADEAAQAEGKPKMANAADKVKIGDEEMTVEALVNAYKAKCENGSEGEDLKNEDDEDEDEDEVEIENEDDEDEVEIENEAQLDKEDDPEKSVDDAKDDKKVKNKKVKNARDKGDGKGAERAERLRNAHQRGNPEDYAPNVLSFDPTAKVELGKQRYGS